MKAVVAVFSLSFLYCLPAASQVSATASPVSNSSGSVVNQAVQIVPGQYMKYAVGSGIQCDGATLNISPFVSSTHSFGQPNNEYYHENVYDNSDNFGLIDPETGLDGPDGIPDNPGKVLYTNRREQAIAKTSATTLASQPRFQSHWTGGQSTSARTRNANRSRCTNKPWLTSALTTRWAGSPHAQKLCVRVMALPRPRRFIPFALMLSLSPFQSKTTRTRLFTQSAPQIANGLIPVTLNHPPLL